MEKEREDWLQILLIEKRNEILREKISIKNMQIDDWHGEPQPLEERFARQARIAKEEELCRLDDALEIVMNLLFNPNKPTPAKVLEFRPVPYLGSAIIE